MLKIVKIDRKIIYKADIETNDGISKTEFTSKYTNHTMLFRNRTHENALELSKFIWSLKDQNKESSRSKSSCNLCLLKKLVISNFKEKERLLNK